MESLALRDGRNPRSRLLTPEASRGSDASNGSQSPEECARQMLPSADQLDRSKRYNTLGDLAAHAADRYRVRDYGREPHSPPYSRNDVAKPSLPPLKSVLGSDMVSPPATPSMQDTPIQPSPQEPAFITNYKPVAFYPNKKLRTDQRMQTEISPKFPSPATDSKSYDYNYSDQSGTSDARRMSLPYHNQPEGARSSIAERGSLISSRDQPLSRSTLVTGQNIDDSRFGRALPTPSATTPGALTNLAQSNDSLQHDYFHPRRASTSGYHGYDRYAPAIASPTMSPARHSYQQRSAAPTSSCAEEARRYEHLERRANLDAYGNPRGAEDSPFFMSNHYEYQHGKARKRSNLPKQSTEIMKHWFDQNIHNPYPSEEQKQYFSSATGISLTQVSNWFINHRRRCPELRDRRDRTRIGDREIEL